MDPKVQVEDDLEQNRVTPLNKDVPAYLTDVSFFFKGAKFVYDVQNASVLTMPNGQTYFVVTANRNLKGVTINGDSVNWNQVRYIEINYNDSMQQLKIVSIYTTKLDFRDDMKLWWNGLSDTWKNALGKDRLIGDTLLLSQIGDFRDSLAVVNGREIKVDSNRIYLAIQQVLEQKSIDLSGNADITDLAPLGKMAGLTSVNISNTSAGDLGPLRNLNNLEELDISGTIINSLEPLKFLTRIRILKMAKTPITDISLVSGFTALEMLDISDTRIGNLEPVKDLAKLADLRLSGTKITSLKTMTSLSNLEILYLNNTQVADLAPLSKMTRLQILFCDSSNVMDLTPLNGLPELKRIYCDKSLIKHDQATTFMLKNPSVLVIFESVELATWWASATDEWKKILSYYTSMDARPSKEQLHRLASVDSINISGRTSITSLAPLEMMKKLRYLACANTGITDLSSLENLIDLKEIDFSNTSVSSVLPLKDLKMLTNLYMDNSKVSDLAPLKNLSNLKMVYADNSGITLPEAARFALMNPECLVIFQTYENTSWWKNIPEPWKQVFLDKMGLSGVPDKVRLQQIANLEKLEISDNSQVSGLQPLLHLSRLKEVSLMDVPVTSLDVLGQMKQLRTIRVIKTPVSDLAPLSGLIDLQELDFSNTQVEDLEPIKGLTNLEILKFSGTQVKNIKYLDGMSKLKVVEMYNTRVSSLDVLDPISSLRSLKIFNTRISEKKVEKFKAGHPGCDVIYY